MKILLVDDDEIIREVFLDALSIFFDESDIEVAENGEEALEKFKKDDFDLVITDVTMPKMDGIELSEKILNIKKIPIIVLTGHNENDLIDKISTLEVAKILHKPLKFNELEDILQKLNLI